MSERRQPYGYRPIGQVPRVLNDSLPERERERAHKHRQHQRSMKSYKVKFSQLYVGVASFQALQQKAICSL